MSEHVDPTKHRRLVCTPLSPPPASTQTKNSTHSIHTAGSASIVLPCRTSLKKCKLPWPTASLESAVWKVMTPSFAITHDFIRVFRAFYAFLGPSVDQLTYWGTDEPKSNSVSRTKLCPMDQLLMTLMRLRLNLEEQDLPVELDCKTYFLCVCRPIVLA